MVIAVPVLLVLLVAAMTVQHRAVRWIAIALAFVLGCYTGNTWFGHFVMSLVNSL